MNILSRFCSYALALLIATAPARAQQEPRHVPATGHMRLTASESLWTRRFSDCDFRYYVLIPNGFVAHGNRPPRRLHGVLFGLPDTSTTDVVTFDDERFSSLVGSSNEFDFKSLKAFCRSCFELSRQGQIGIRDQGVASVPPRWGAGNQIEG